MSPAAPPPELDGRQRRHLRALAHHQKAIVQIGGQGVTPGVIQAVDAALSQHELVKVRVAGDAPAAPAEVGPALAGSTRSALAQIIGRTLLLYRPHPKKPRIVLPRGGKRTQSETAEPDEADDLEAVDDLGADDDETEEETQ